MASAKKLLVDIRELLAEIETNRAQIIPNLDQIQEQLELIAEKSGTFYEMIPTGASGNDAIRPLNTENDVKNALDMLYNISTLEVAAKVILGAKYRLSTINPYEYVIRAMDISMEVLTNESLEHAILVDYFNFTNSDHRTKIEQIFKIQRKGEPEKMEKWKHLENHYLLWHGSQTCNFIGILTQGLRIAPPEAPASGYAFGKGLYFADLFRKSINYTSLQSSGYNYTKTYGFLLLCEVALGEIYYPTSVQYMDKPPEGFNSTCGRGHTYPDWSSAIVLPNGVKVPYSHKLITANDSTIPRLMNHNEFIVYDTSQVRLRYLMQVSRSPY